MDILYACCAGLDVHKDTVVACVRRQEAGPRRAREVVRTFGTTTRDLLALADWLTAEGVTHVGMESTGVYWKPVWNVLEGQFELALINAQHIKQVPGRKTDVKDSAWIAQLLQHGLVRGSYVPDAPQRDLRELTRQRRQLTHMKTAVANRLQKVLEDANLKLGSVASDVLGMSGRDMLRAIIAGRENANGIANLARGLLRNKRPALEQALNGKVRDHHRFLLQQRLAQVEQIEAWIEALTARIQEVMPAPFAEAKVRLQTIPGIGERAAEDLLAEVGTDMKPFASAAHLASWAGMCPGNRESAGKRKSGRTRPGNRWLRATLVQSAWAASHTKNTYLTARYRRLASRRGKKRAVVALGHTLLIVLYHVLKEPTTYKELGADYFDRLDVERTKRSLVRRLEHLGLDVKVTPRPQAA